ncbi:helix-turn-helix domain-containing protein [Methylobacterium sp. J-072]|uniref:helix-turn-helix domain-containing protein n=1 Tax=Methylobacterium sp. J-072 TaxID=2836651 RepID=UPI001FB95F3B|nr:helix-turn-helix domain-containing protein [Methylobacterium sp. J-072]MCJ2092625.1 helix-turn-helix domain-containing protein [Methylobacterium sp. J-072]
MRDLFLTKAAKPQDRYKDWREFSDERFMPMVHTRTNDDVFDASAKGTALSFLDITRVSLSAVTLDATAQTVRHHLNKPDVLGFSIKIDGGCAVTQYDRTFIQKRGDISIVDANAPFRFTHFEKSEHLIVQIPRNKIEYQLGSARNFVALSMKDAPTSTLVASFFRNLLQINHELTTDAASRLASIGSDLIVASVAERMAMETPKSLRGTVAVQNAKAYIESNISDQSLAPSQVAAAVGVSLRQLQSLFSDRGQQLSAWILRRRLEIAAERLTDLSIAHLSIGDISYSCGFSNQSHFSHRFKERYDISPLEFRHLKSSAGTMATSASTLTHQRQVIAKPLWTPPRVEAISSG